jgi:benzoyl-CoA reductase subunit C
MTAIETINQIASDMRGYLIDAHQKSGKKFLGVMHAVVPQELLYAAGLHPFRLFPFPGEPITAARAHLHVDTSSIFRAIWDQVLKERYPFMDGVVLPESCETVTYFARGWKYHRPKDFVATIAGVRFSKTQNALKFFCKELESLSRTVEKFSGTSISADSLAHAISVYNKNRALIRGIYDLRKSESPPLSGVEALKTVMVSHIMDKEENNHLLETLLEELKNRGERQKPTARLMVSGPCITDIQLLETLEASGALVVTDDTNMGSRSFFYTVDSDQNRLMALAKAYEMIPCPFSISAENRLNYITKMAAEYKIDGVVFAIEKACESEKMDFPYLEKEIKTKAKLPVTFIETEYLCDMAPIRTRIDAFVESLMK